MSAKNWFLAILEAILWYLFIVYFLYVVKNDVSIFQSALVLLIIAYAATMVCPWIRETSSWKRLWNKQ